MRDRQHPGLRGGISFKAPGIAPDLHEHLVRQLFCDGLVAHDAQQEPIDAQLMPSDQKAQGRLVLIGNARDQLPVIRLLGHRGCLLVFVAVE